MSTFRIISLFACIVCMAASLIMQGLDWNLLSRYVMPAMAMGALSQFLHDRIVTKKGSSANV